MRRPVRRRLGCTASGARCAAPNSSAPSAGRAGCSSGWRSITRGFERKDSALVSRGLRQFFLAYLMSGKRHVSMPSQVADDLWHEFILYTRDYDAFCRRAPSAVSSTTPPPSSSASTAKSNEGLRRVWWYCCKYENIDPVSPTRLPLLFALDSKLNIAKRVRLSPRLRRAAQERQRCGVLRRRFRRYARSTAVRTGLATPAATAGGDGGGDGGGGGDGAAEAAAAAIETLRERPDCLQQRRLLDLLDAKSASMRAHGLHAAPFVAVARDRKQIVGRGRIMPVRQRRRRRHADRGICRSAPSSHIVEWMWSWPCRTSSTPRRFSTARSAFEIRSAASSRESECRG